jgi:hypothetical protein
LIQTGRPLDGISVADLDVLADRALFHPGVAYHLPAFWQAPKTLADRLADTPAAVRPWFIAYLERTRGTCRSQTVGSLSRFGRFLAKTDPAVPWLSDVEQCRHFEPSLNSVAATPQHQDRRADHQRRSVPPDLGRRQLPARHQRLGAARRARSWCSPPT